MQLVTATPVTVGPWVAADEGLAMGLTAVRKAGTIPAVGLWSMGTHPRRGEVRRPHTLSRAGERHTPRSDGIVGSGP